VTWPPRTAPPELAAGEVHLWALRLDVPSDALWPTLSAEEQARCARLVAATAGARAAVARGLLRLLLAAYAEVAPHALRFAVRAQGKPYLTDVGLRFNLAHSDDLAVVAVARDVEVGVDVERLRPVADGLSLAARYFAPDEARALAALPADERDEAFLRLWTSKEAVLKATGEGLTGGLAGDAEASWSLHAIEPAIGYVGALAVQAPACRLRCHALGLGTETIGPY
jgi:4'-phosphopantetheinyl transferase